MSALSTLLARCCCAGGGGTNPYNGNSLCVPPCAGQPGAFKTTWSATSQYFSRGMPTGFTTVTLDCHPCYPQRTIYSSANFDVGPFPETFVMQGFPRWVEGGNGCAECDTLTVSWTPSAQTFTAVVRDPPFPQSQPSTGQTLSVSGEPFAVQSNWYRCNPFGQADGIQAYGGCSGWTGLFEVIILRASRQQYSPLFPIYGVIDYSGGCPVGPIEDGYAMGFFRGTSVFSMYVKPVPFTNCIDRRGTYYLAASEASYNWTTYTLWNITGMPQKARVDPTAPCLFEELSLCDPLPCSNPRESRCGTSPPGWTLPGTIEVTAI